MDDKAHPFSMNVQFSLDSESFEQYPDQELRYILYQVRFTGENQWKSLIDYNGNVIGRFRYRFD